LGCGFGSRSCNAVQAHTAGRKHKRRMEATAGRGHVKPSAHYCVLCEISTTSSAHLALHLVGRAHRRRQKALDDGESLHPVSLMGHQDGNDFSSSADPPGELRLEIYSQVSLRGREGMRKYGAQLCTPQPEGAPGRQYFLSSINREFHENCENSL
jgi:hypothetical protein